MLFAAYLSHAGYSIVILDTDEAKINSITDNDIKVLSPARDEILRASPYETLLPAHLEKSNKFKNCKYYIFCVKSFSTKNAAESICKFVNPDSIVATLQNGAGNIETLSAFFKLDNIAAGTTTEGATLLEPGIVIHGGKGSTFIGLAASSATHIPRLNPLIAAFEKAGFKTSYTDNPRKMIWEKLAVNASINPITSILKTNNGAIIENNYLKNLIKIITAEVCLAANNDSIKLNPDEMYNKVLEVAENTKANKSSMLQDILAGKKTEIENISGFVAKAAENAGLPAKANLALFLLVKALESR